MNTKHIKHIVGLLLLLFGIFAVQAQNPTPGGIDMSTNGYTLDLWVDGNTSTSSSWPNKVPTANFTLTANGAAPVLQNSEFNFHRELRFSNAAGSAHERKLRTSAPYPLTANQGYYAFVVSQRNSTVAEQFLIAYNPVPGTGYPMWGRSVSLQWNDATTPAAFVGRNIRFGWGAGNAGTTTNNNNMNLGAINLGASGNTPYAGIAALNVDNTTPMTDRATVYMNGESKVFSPAALGINNTTVTSHLTIGNRESGTGSNAGLVGSIQEVIVMRGNGKMPQADVQKIQSYLAIKYGLELHENAGNYVDSEGKEVWTRSKNLNFNNRVFGIGRDNASGLNQVQSRSSRTAAQTVVGDFTVYKGTLNQLNNNNSTVFIDRTYIMFGGSNVTSNTSYVNEGNVPFENMPNGTGKVTSYFGRIYKAQITVAGEPATTAQEINVQVTSTKPEWVFVSPTTSFTPEQTRVYAINNRIAEGITIKDGEYIAFGGFEPRPGGLLAYTMDLWIDGNSFATGSTPYENLTSCAFSVQAGAVVAGRPVSQASRFNFHKDMYFATSQVKLRSAASYSFAVGTAYHVFVVSEQNAQAEGTLLAFSAGSSNTTRSMRWMNSTSSVMQGWWTNFQRNPNFASSDRYGIATMSVNNNSGGAAFSMFFNGNRFNTNLTNAAANNTTSATNTANTQIVIGSGLNTDANLAGGFVGAVQEVIVMRGGADAISETDAAKVHSYLAVKYGIHLSAGNYVNTGGNPIWSRPAGYDHNVFGIGRDDATGLYQKQARSASNNLLTVFLGNRLPAFNTQNTETLSNGEYLMIGSAASITNFDAAGFAYTGYLNGSIAGEKYNMHSLVYQAQLTGMTEKEVSIKIQPIYLYALVSKTDAFDPTETYIYQLEKGVGQITLSQDYPFFKGVGFMTGPGGVVQGGVNNVNLALWLRADDEFGVVINDRPLEIEGNTDLTGYTHSVADRDHVPTVPVWHDLERGHTYTYAGAAATRVPVLERNHPEVNFNHGIRLWGTGGADSNVPQVAYFGNAKGIMANNQNHTTILALSHSFHGLDTRDVNLMFFAGGQGVNTTGTQPASTYDSGPGYGLARVSSTALDSQGRLRFRGGSTTNTPEVRFGSQNLFNSGAFASLGYYLAPSTTPVQPGAPTDGRRFYWRFNGIEEGQMIPTAAGAWNLALNNPHQLGRGYHNGRSLRGMFAEVIMYQGLLDQEQKLKVDTYLALKYGQTIRANDTSNLDNTAGGLLMGTRNATGYLDYTVQNGTNRVWPAMSSTDDSPFRRFYANIAAVIRDDITGIYQRQAHSTDVGSIVYMGLAGERLTDDGSMLGSFESDGETVIWGSNNYDVNRKIQLYDGTDAANHQVNDGKGITPQGLGIIQRSGEECGEFDYRFERIWFVHNNAGRPMDMIVALRNNATLTFGQGCMVTDNYYSKLNPGSDFVLIVGESEAHIKNGEYQAVIPMTYFSNRTGASFQTNYTFPVHGSSEGTYITFGYKQTGKGCEGNPDAVFDGSKRFDFRWWTSARNRIADTAAASTSVDITSDWIDLGNNIASRTQVKYPGGTYSGTRTNTTATGVRAYRGYPRSVNTPAAGSLEIRRRGGQPAHPASDVEIRMTFNNPVEAEFMIAHLGGSRNYFEEVEIFGYCGDDHTHPIYPVLSHVGSQSTAAYRITNNKATVTKYVRLRNANDVKGQLKVAFPNGVSEILIKYRAVGSRTLDRHSIVITPVILRAVLPPPFIDENGLSFSARVQESEITTCEEAKFTYRIQNINCDGKYVQELLSTLDNPNMIWESLTLDDLNDNRLANPESEPAATRISVEGFGTQTLKVNNLWLSPTSDLRIVGTAIFKEDTPQFDDPVRITNTASMKYDKESGILGQPPSLELITMNLSAYCYAEWRKRNGKVTIDVVVSRESYVEGNEVEYTLTINNPLWEILDSWFDIEFNEGFELLGVTLPAGTDMKLAEAEPDPQDSNPKPNFFTIVGPGYGNDEGEAEGFTLPFGTSVIKFKLKAPYPMADEDKLPLEVTHAFSTSEIDPCLVLAFKDLDGLISIPYGRKIERMVTNRHLQHRMHPHRR